MSKEYQKISGLYAREEVAPFKLIEGTFREPEIELLKDIDWEFTEKIDGTNVRVHWDGYNVSFEGRTKRAEMPKHLLDRLEELFGGEIKAQAFEQKFGTTEVTLYGEGFGPKIQKGGGNYGQSVNFILFDVVINGWYLQRKDVESIAHVFDVEVVPIIHVGQLEDGIALVREGMQSTFGEFEAEGLVAKPVVTLLNRKGERIIVKIKHRDFEELEKQRERALQEPNA